MSKCQEQHTKVEKRRKEHPGGTSLREVFVGHLSFRRENPGGENLLSKSLEGCSVWCVGTGLPTENKGQRKLSGQTDVKRRGDRIITLF